MPVNMNLAALYMNENGEYKPIPGVRGEPGVTPTISVEDIPGGHRVTIAGAEGSTSIDVMDGTNGVSPTVAVTDVTGGHRVTITDATGSSSFDVMDGANGSDGTPGATGPAGPGVPAGGTAGQVLKKKTATDYDAEWGDAGGSGIIVTFTRSGSTYTADKTYVEVRAAFEAGTLIYGKLNGSDNNALFTVSGFTSTTLLFQREYIISNSVRTQSITFPSSGTPSVESQALNVPAAVSVPIYIYVDDELEYQDPPTGTLSAGDIPGYAMENFIWDEGMAVYALYGEDLSGTGTSEKYSLASIDVESRYYEDWGSDAPYIKAHFRTIGERNGTPLLKKIVIEGFTDVSLYQATVTYSETTLAVQS